MTRAAQVIALVVATLPFAGCLRTPKNPPPSCDDQVCTVESGDALLTVVNATDQDFWTHLDLETASVVETDTPQDDGTWDLGFRRMVVKSNSGVNGSGGVLVCVLEDTDFDDVTAAPATCNWRTDNEGRPDPRDPGGTVMNDDPWYDYDLVDHTLKAKERRVYIVETGDGTFVKVHFEDYYSTEGVAGWPSFLWSVIPGF